MPQVGALPFSLRLTWSDAAVAVAAALNVTQPCSTGIGGDAFCLFYDAKSRTVKGLNGSGRAPNRLSLAHLQEQGVSELPPFSVDTITVPGAAAAWVDTVEGFGSRRLTLADVLQPAIDLAESGYPVAPVTAEYWRAGLPQITRSGSSASEMLMPSGSAPRAGEIMRMPQLANTFRLLAAHGKPGFYDGTVARAIVDLVQREGGVMELTDLAAHESTFVDPISSSYRGVEIWEIPPNGQGITALLALNVLSHFEVAALPHNSAPYLHLLIESLRLAFADSRHYVADPTKASVPTQALLSLDYSRERAKLISPTGSNSSIQHGYPEHDSGTVYFSVVDREGNACSFINSNYMGFGTGYVPKGCGFTLHNRGHNFSCIPGHPNALAGGKRPYHTIIPGMATRNGQLYCSFGVMGGWMQPQGHVQVLVNMLDKGMDPQTALDLPRFCIADGTHNGAVLLEEGIASDTIAQLRQLGHDLQAPVVTGHARSVFGMGQVIVRDGETGVLCAGSDPRGDGCAIGW